MLTECLSVFVLLSVTRGQSVTSNEGPPDSDLLSRDSEQDSNITAYHHEQTVLILHQSAKGKILGCKMVDVKDPAEKNVILKQLESLPQKETTLEQQILLMEICLLHHREMESSPPVGTFQLLVSMATDLNKVFQQNIPGTVWCGVTNSAKDYNDLGPDRHVDICCRQHDHCPVKVDPFSRRYGLSNNAWYPVSHCLCDDRMIECMRTANSTLAKVIGTFYFNVIQLPCLEYKKELACKAHDLEGNCLTAVEENKLIQVPKKHTF